MGVAQVRVVFSNGLGPVGCSAEHCPTHASQEIYGYDYTSLTGDGTLLYTYPTSLILALDGSSNSFEVGASNFMPIASANH